MIVVDSSALIAVLFEEPEKQAFQEIIDGDERCILSAVNAHETACVLRGRHGVAAVARFWQWLIDNEIEIVAFDEVQVRAAAAAWPRPNIRVTRGHLGLSIIGTQISGILDEA